MIRGDKSPLLILSGCLLLGVAWVAMLPRDPSVELDCPPKAGFTAKSKVSTAGDRKVKQATSLPSNDWETNLRRYRNGNRRELEQRLALLDERVGLTPIQAINLRSHMEGWYDSWEKEMEQNRRWIWPDHREIIWSRICGSLFVSKEQAVAYLTLDAEIGLQRSRNRAVASELVAHLKQRTELPPYLENLMVPFLEAWQTSAQGLAKTDAGAGEVSWRDGLRSGDFDPLSDLLDAKQLAELVELLEENAGATAPPR